MRPSGHILHFWGAPFLGGHKGPRGRGLGLRPARSWGRCGQESRCFARNRDFPRRESSRIAMFCKKSRFPTARKFKNRDVLQEIAISHGAKVCARAGLPAHRFVGASRPCARGPTTCGAEQRRPRIPLPFPAVLPHFLSFLPHFSFFPGAHTAAQKICPPGTPALCTASHRVSRQRGLLQRSNPSKINRFCAISGENPRRWDLLRPETL